VAGSSVSCAGTTSGQYQIRAQSVALNNTGNMTLTGSSFGLIYAVENLANNVSIRNQGSMTWSGAVFGSPVVANTSRALANIGFVTGNNFTSANLVNEVGASMTLLPNDNRTNIGLNVVALAVSNNSGTGTVTNHGTLTYTNTATGASVASDAINVMAQNYVITNTGSMIGTSSATSPTLDNHGIIARHFTPASGGFGQITNSGSITLTDLNATRTRYSYGIYAEARRGLTVDNSGDILVTAVSPAATGGAAGIYPLITPTGSAATVQVTNTGSVVVDSPSNNFAAAFYSNTNGNANPIVLDNSGLIELKNSYAAVTSDIYRAAVLFYENSGFISPITVTNTAGGVIRASGSSYAFRSYGAPPVTLNNAGTVQGSIKLSTGADTLTQTAGSITGDIDLGSNADAMTASGGALIGNTTLGAGNDQLHLIGGVDVSQVGHFDGGAGIDDLTLDGIAIDAFTAAADNLAQGRNLTAWESIAATNASTLRLTGDLFDAANTGALSVDASSQVSVLGTAAAPSLTIFGAVDLAGQMQAANNATTNTTTVTGNFTGAAGSVYALDTSLGGDASPTDKLIVQGSTSGETTLTIANVGGLGALTGTGIEVVRVQGVSDGVFKLAAPGYLTAGGYRYELVKTGTNWYLKSFLAPNPFGAGTTAAVPTLQTAGTLALSLALGWLGIGFARRSRQA
jgi:hypothetical protein